MERELPFFCVCFFFVLQSYLEPETPIFLAAGYQLDDEPNLYLENGWKSQFPSHFTLVGFRVPGR